MKEYKWWGSDTQDLLLHFPLNVPLIVYHTQQRCQTENLSKYKQSICILDKIYFGLQVPIRYPLQIILPKVFEFAVYSIFQPEIQYYPPTVCRQLIGGVHSCGELHGYIYCRCNYTIKIYKRVLQLLSFRFDLF